MDVVVTVPKGFTHPDAPGLRGLAAWLAEGDPPGSEWSGRLWSFSTHGAAPSIEPGERVYVLCEGRIVGYAPLVRVRFAPDVPGSTWGRVDLVRGGGAVACTIPLYLSRSGFRGWRRRWWNYADELPIPAAAAAAPLESPP